MARKSECPEAEYRFINGLIEGSSTKRGEERVVEGIEGFVSEGMQAAEADTDESENDELRSLAVNNYFPDGGESYGGCGCMI